MTTSTWPEKRALTVSLFGLAFQTVVAAFLLVLALWDQSHAARAAAMLAAGGIPIWLVLALVFQQRRLVREEALESEQLRREREAAGAGPALFAGDEERLLLARRRLVAMYRWLVPGASLAIIGLLVLLSLWSWSWGLRTSLRDSGWSQPVTQQLPSAFAAGAVAFLAFLFSRYATGMARQAEWRLLRAGAAYLMGVAAACAALCVTIGLAHFEMVMPERVLAYVLRILMLVLAGEILLNFVLDLYRPRRPDEEPRPPFDSRLFGLFCEPGGIARSIAEAINYQFGFEVSSTWFYKLLQRAMVPVLFFGVVSMFAVSCIVIVDSGDAVIVERWGNPRQTGRTEGTSGVNIRRDVLGPGIHFKLPWPIEKTYRYPVDRVLDVTIGLTGTEEETGARLDEPLLWTKKHEWVPHLMVMVATDEKVIGAAAQPETPPTTNAAATTTQPVESRSVPVSLLKVSMAIQYRISDLDAWRTKFADPEAAFRDVAFRALTRYCAKVDVDQVMGAERMKLGHDLRDLVQAEADRLGLGIRILVLGMQSVHPPEEVAKEFEGVVGAESKKWAEVRRAEGERNTLLANVCGDVERAEQLATAISQYNDPSGPADVRAAAKQRIDDLFDGNPGRGVLPISGEAAERVAGARADMWRQITTARADAEMFVLELPVYRAAPRIYRVRKYLEALSDSLTKVRKYLIASDVEVLLQLDVTDPRPSGIEQSLETPKP